MDEKKAQKVVWQNDRRTRNSLLPRAPLYGLLFDYVDVLRGSGKLVLDKEDKKQEEQIKEFLSKEFPNFIEGLEYQPYGWRDDCYDSMDRRGVWIKDNEELNLRYQVAFIFYDLNHMDSSLGICEIKKSLVDLASGIIAIGSFHTMKYGRIEGHGERKKNSATILDSLIGETVEYDLVAQSIFSDTILGIKNSSSYAYSKKQKKIIRPVDEKQWPIFSRTNEDYNNYEIFFINDLDVKRLPAQFSMIAKVSDYILDHKQEFKEAASYLNNALILKERISNHKGLNSLEIITNHINESIECCNAICHNLREDYKNLKKQH